MADQASRKTSTAFTIRKKTNQAKPESQEEPLPPRKKKAKITKDRIELLKENLCKPSRRMINPKEHKEPQIKSKVQMKIIFSRTIKSVLKPFIGMAYKKADLQPQPGSRRASKSRRDGSTQR